MKPTLILLLTLCSTLVLGQRALKPSDVYSLKNVSELEVSPAGKWIAYVVTIPDSVKDNYNSDVWMTAVDGSGSVQLTYTEKDESNVKFSPDGKSIAFLSERLDAKEAQVWVMDTRGGEARQLTKIKEGISDYSWSPDSKRMILTITDKEIKPDSLKEKPGKPIVIDRYHFKQDINGYIENKHTHLYLFDIATSKLDTLTKGKFDHGEATWSPDGKHIAFTSNRTDDPDRNTNSDIWIIEAKANATARQLTTWVDFDSNPVWSPDGKSIAYLRSVSPEWDSYDQPQLAVISVNGGTPVLLSEKLDRPINNPEWSMDGKSIYALIEDDRERYIMSFDVASKKYEKQSEGKRSITFIKPITETSSAVLMSDSQHPIEIYVFEKNEFKKLTHHNDEFVAQHAFATVDGFNYNNKEGITIGGLLYWPNGKPRNQKLPLILWIHGGPVAQDEYEFDLTPQILASQGYAVACINYRGSNGRGYAFAKAISADWGNKEVVDLLAGVDHLIKTGVADPNRLGIGGWSYGGILTDYATATDARFKAAASGAGSALQLSMYGVDQYIQQYELELGVPWKNVDKWIKISYPFFHVDKIKTPTLYMVGQNDFNVPAVGSEQMYQALRSLNVPTQLIIYPNQFHGFTVPSYWKDRYARYAEWFGKYIK
ncbi:MAG TPA: S9 family peptidase [Chryseolinea sp.]|nr:S9 family peptidase [Chryseolinea sp.]HPM29606.1 S9 family peptidase [Chryseolinea sp.]